MAGETFDGFGYAAHGHGEQPAPTFGGEGGFWWSPSAEALARRSVRRGGGGWPGDMWGLPPPTPHLLLSQLDGARLGVRLAFPT